MKDLDQYFFFIRDEIWEISALCYLVTFFFFFDYTISWSCQFLATQLPIDLCVLCLSTNLVQFVKWPEAKVYSFTSVPTTSSGISKNNEIMIYKYTIFCCGFWTRLQNDSNSYSINTIIVRRTAMARIKKYKTHKKKKK